MMEQVMAVARRPGARMVVLTGAGISAESGINTFRAADGLWEDHPVEQVATPEGYLADPALVHRFYNARRAQLSTVEPNAGHVALAELEKAFGDRFLLVTQNVDDLHERGGSRRLIHMHGSLRQVRCTNCGDVFACDADVSTDAPCEGCERGGGLRPDIVWFGEIPYEMDRITRALESCDLFVSIGTSGSVYPAAQFGRMAAEAGALTVELNLETTNLSHLFDASSFGPASTVVPAFVASLI